MRYFLWEGFDGHNSSHLVSWETISNSKENGGLGIGNLPLRNKALLGKWWWRFPRRRIVVGENHRQQIRDPKEPLGPRFGFENYF